MLMAYLKVQAPNNGLLSAAADATPTPHPRILSVAPSPSTAHRAQQRIRRHHVMRVAVLRGHCHSHIHCHGLDMPLGCPIDVTDDHCSDYS
jgi:hypothetical protein